MYPGVGPLSVKETVLTDDCASRRPVTAAGGGCGAKDTAHSMRRPAGE